MAKCKNIECHNDVKNKRIYCSLKCRNHYVNLYLRDYQKNGEGIREKYKDAYEKTPKICKVCSSAVPYSLRKNDCCSRICYIKLCTGRKGYIPNDKENKDRVKKLIKTLKAKGVSFVVSCPFCGADIPKKKRLKYCDINCKKNFQRKDLSEYRKYYLDARFNFRLSDYPEEFDFDLIRRYGWYKPVNRGNNLTGVSRDHIFSVRAGFKERVDPKIIAHPANCQLIIHNKNVSKYTKCGLTKKQLLVKIEKWNQKYGIKL